MAVRTLSHLLLQVSDLEAAEAFYVGVLGFSVKDRTPLRDGRPLVVTHQRMGLTVYPPGGPPTVKTVDHIAFVAADFPDLLRRLQETAVTYEGPMPTPYGQSVYFRDPDGNKIEVHD